MKPKITGVKQQNILGKSNSLSNREILTSFLKQFRQKLGIYSMFAALPGIFTSNAQAGQPQDQKKTEDRFREEVKLVERLNKNSDKAEFSCRRSNFLLPHQKSKYSDIISEMVSGDNCPGNTIPGGTYTAAAPFTDSGDTTGANDTVSRLQYNAYYNYYYNAPGPDQIYTFKLTGRGPNPQIQVSATSANYDPLIYMIEGGCPAGTGNSVSKYTWLEFTYSASPAIGGFEILSDWQINSLPLNVPLYLFIDSAGSGANSAGSYTIRMQDVTVAPAEPPRTKFDFDGDAKADISVFRPLDRVWYLNRSTLGFFSTQFGLSTDKIVPDDYDGDGKTDIAVFRDGTWYLLRSTEGFSARHFGLASDIPVPADFTGDGRAELAVYRNGNWYTLNLQNNQFQAVQFGLSTDKPVASDYDGDGRADYAVYRDGVWYLLRTVQGFTAIQFGLPTDQPVPADYDDDGKTDVAVYRDGVWYLLRSQTGFTAFQFGVSTDIPAPADYDGDGRADAAVYRDGIWYLLQSTNGFSAIQFGLMNDKPVPTAYLP
jgi:(2Fe-2S) ferredoxin